MALPDDFQDDTKIYPILAELSACLCNALGATTPCFCGIIVGSEIPLEYATLDGCDSCGIAYVRLVNAFPSVDFPDPDDRAQCTTIMAYTVAVGVVRCFVDTDDDGDPVPQEDIADMSRLMLSDMAKIRRTIQCCFGSSFEDVDYVVGTYTPVEGDGVRGGEQLLIVHEEI